MSANWLNNVMYKFTLRLKFFMIDVNNWVFILCFLTPTSLHLFFCIFYIFPYRYLSSGSIIVIWMETITIKFKSFIENKWVWRIQLWLGTSTSIGRKWWSDSKQVFICFCEGIKIGIFYRVISNWSTEFLCKRISR